ncbi:transcriptional regulator [Virgisporangium aliadipatigenens]|uniref:Transcriptional regulator n=1 Tax=Virgisporangium aliadipatigenens TaxID=741659 RepID=A0A8J3YW82_9ACTN|nr:helix-turn-helix domain-containing protein [Virgisporangium aliadipatigenens]GIJ50931.1 transcriptional regulator [Virgisporangium aliadipatigenens]
MESVLGSVRLDTEQLGVQAFSDAWGARIGPALPTFGHEATAGVVVRGLASRVGDSTITDFEAATPVRVDTSLPDNGELRLYIVHRGRYRLRGERDTMSVAGGEFLMTRSTGLSDYAIAAGTTAQVIGLPAEVAGVFADFRQITGPVTAATVRVLLAHTAAIQSNVDDLGDSGAHASRNALIELVRGVLHARVDATEAGLAGPLTRVARALADQLLTERELAPALLAGRLGVSLRTLHRAFASTGETVGAYIRRRRLEQARRALTSPSHTTIAEIAAHWQFADSSHFARAFRRHYGQTPSGFARDHDHPIGA